MTKKYIWITTNFEGFHVYKEAPDSVSFLRDVHRHLFYIKVFIEVLHNNRDIEFIIFKRFINNLCDTLDKLDLGSCEMISDKLHQNIVKEYPDRSIIIDVSEDNENGCHCIY